jgi:benzoyl-CoA reductase subunit C
MTEYKEQNVLAIAEKYYNDYGLRARELKAEGRKIIGYLSAIAPVEIMTAAGVVPFRLKGNASEAITRSDAHMENIVCPFVRNVFDSALKGKFNFLDGMIIPHLCDSIERTSDIWNYNLKLPYWHFLNVPHVADEPSLNFMKDILRIFIASLEKFTGKKITDDAIEQSVRDHNDNRRLMRDLYALRKNDPPLITGTEMIKVLVSAMSLPVIESSRFIRNIIIEIKNRKTLPDRKSVRLMLIGDQIDNAIFIDAIEKNAHLVMDDISIGSKIYWPDIDITFDPIHGIAERYLRKLKLPTTFVALGSTYKENLEHRFGHINQFINEFNVQGVILLIYKFCDPYGFEVPALKSYIESAGTKVLYLEDEYTTSTIARVKTRIEAFVETFAL